MLEYELARAAWKMTENVELTGAGAGHRTEPTTGLTRLNNSNISDKEELSRGSLSA